MLIVEAVTTATKINTILAIRIKIMGRGIHTLKIVGIYRPTLATMCKWTDTLMAMQAAIQTFTGLQILTITQIHTSTRVLTQ